MIKREATALQFSNSILGWTISQSVQSMMHKVQQSCTIKKMSRANEERKLNPATLYYNYKF